MQPELKEFLSALLPYAFGGSAEKAFLRNKKPPEVKVFACYLYMQGPSLRQSERLLEDLGVELAHSAIWYWLQQVGAHVGGRIVPRRKRQCLIVDETEVKTRSG